MFIETSKLEWMEIYTQTVTFVLFMTQELGEKFIDNWILCYAIILPTAGQVPIADTSKDEEWVSMRPFTDHKYSISAGKGNK